MAKAYEHHLDDFGYLLGELQSAQLMLVQHAIEDADIAKCAHLCTVCVHRQPHFHLYIHPACHERHIWKGHPRAFISPFVHAQQLHEQVAAHSLACRQRRLLMRLISTYKDAFVCTGMAAANVDLACWPRL